MGNLLAVKVHAANIHDTKGGCHVYQAAKNKFPDISYHIFFKPEHNMIRGGIRDEKR
jgi:hypothetical protein